MSVGTMVTIVLLMIVLVLGIFFIQKIFGAGTDAIDTIDNEVQSQIQKLFAEEGRKVAVYPTSREITIKKGDDPAGFAFSVRNTDVEESSFSYNTYSTDVSTCGSTFSEAHANNMLLAGTGSFNLGPGNSLDIPILVRFVVPESTPPCTIVYQVDIEKDGGSYSTIPGIAVTIK